MVLMEKQRQAQLRAFDFRPATMADSSAAVSLFNTCSLDLTGRASTDLRMLITDWQTPGFDLENSTRVVIAPSGSVVGYVEVWDLSELPVTARVWGRVHPEYRHRGIGTWLMTWAEARARQAIERVPPDARVTLYADALSSHEPANRLFESRGFRPARQFREMQIALDNCIPAAQWPANVTLSTFADHPDLPAVYQALLDAFKDHWGFVEQPGDSELDRWRHWIENDKAFDPTTWFLAMQGEEIAGFCLCRSGLPNEPDRAHVDQLGVRRPWRRQGLALAMLQHAFAELKARGRRRVSLGVDATSLTGADRLYQKAGMHVEEEYTAFEKTLRPGKDLRKLQ